ncbi:TON1 Recruiting Motif 15 [Hibiscus trionum]|uniref:TON1 Recruiting Motif 15 n=1 Tax=Hibiscus trionum TaxID=183268 RepID=A0A9W7I7I6_HIBTR|nr:TON1 Recruiting Motif 15 [Hibiscus trionum]
MAKRSDRVPLRYEKDQSSCMWGLISMLDFRHSRSTQRLLSIRRRGNENEVCVGNAESKLMSTCSAENCPRPLDGEEETTATDACKPSVKKLLEEEMTGEKVDKKEASNNEVEAKLFDSGRKKWNRKNKTCKKSSSNNLDMDVAEKVVSEGSCRYKPEQQTTSNHDIDNLMEEFFRKVHQKSINCVNHDQLEQSSKSYGLEERLSEAIELLVSHKLLNGNQLTEDGEVRASKEVMDALQISSLDEELFSKLVRYPNSLLLKYVQDSPDAHLKDEESSKPLAESNCSDMEYVDLRQRKETVNRKHRTLFRRKPKCQERDLWDGNKASQASNKIVNLKPGSTCMQTPETGSSTSSSSESHYIIGHGEPNEKVGSHFFLAEIKRKLKHAMGREHHRIPRDGMSERFTNEQQNSGESGVKEHIGMNSPTKDHFKTSMLKGSELGREYETTDLSRPRVSIYIEGRNHLSELLLNGEENVDLSSTQVQKTSDGILSLPEYNSSAVGSPGRYLEPSFITGSDKSQVGEHNQVNLVSNLSQMAEKIDSRLCSSGNKTCNEVEGDNAISDKLDTCENNDKEDPFFCSTKDEMSSVQHVICLIYDDNHEYQALFVFNLHQIYADSWSIVEATEIMVHEEIKLLDASSGTSDSSDTTDDKIVEIYEEQNPRCLKQDSSDMDQQPFSPLASPLNPSVTEKVECIESVTDIQEWSSPISVLQPIFTDDLISSASINSYSGETSLQPLRIRFGEQSSLATNRSNHMKACMDDKESIFEHIKAVLQASSFNWDELYIRSLSSDVLINPLLLDGVEYLPNQLCQDQSLLFDCINEVLVEFCGHYFGSPSISFVKPNIRPLPNMNNTIQEVSKGVYWHLLPMPLPLTLDLIVSKDLAKSGTWMDLQLDTGCIGVEIGEAIFEDIVEDAITSYIYESRECKYNVLPA